MYVNGSEEFNKAIDDTVNTALHHRLVFTDDNSVIESISKLNGYISSNNASELQIGTTNMSYVEVEAYTDKILTGREFRLESGTKLEDGTYEYAPIGYFTVQKPDGDLDIQTFKAFDRMQKLERPYSSSLTEPTTTDKILVEICEICRVTLATPIPTPIEIAKIPQGYTCREVLGYIAGLHAKFACFDRFGELNLRWYSETPIEKKIGLIWSFTKAQEDFTVEKIEIAKDSETKYTSGSGFKTVYHSNPLATQVITDSIMTKLRGFTYNASSIEMLDDIRLDPWDVIKVTYLDGNTYLVPCMAITQNFSDSSTVIQAYAKSDTENEYRFTGPTIQFLNRMATELLVANRVIATKVDAEYVQSHAITTDNLDAITANITNLVVDKIDGKYADIHLANIDIADIGTFFADSGLLKDVTVVDGHITGELDAVRINADVITTGTLSVDRLLVTGKDSIVYQINVDSSGLSETELEDEVYQKYLNGTDIVANSITATQLNVSQIFADKTVTSTLFAQDITATGTITGAKLISADAEISSGKIGGFNITSNELLFEDFRYTIGWTYDRVYYNPFGISPSIETGHKVLFAGGVLGAINNGTYDDKTNKYWANPDNVTYPFYVTTEGYLYSSQGKIGNWEIANGSLEGNGNGWIPPTKDDLEFLADAIKNSTTGSFTATQKKAYDFDANEKIDLYDFANCKALVLGDKTISELTSYTPIKSDVAVRLDPSNPNKFIRLTGTNSFGRDVDIYFGLDGINAPRIDTSFINTYEITIQDRILSPLLEVIDENNNIVANRIVAEQGMYVHDTGLNNWGTAGYIVLARLEVKGDWLSNEQIRFDVKTLTQSGEIIIVFSNTGTVTATTVSSFTRTGNLPPMYYVLTVGTNTVTVEIIVYKHTYQDFVIVNYKCGANIRNKVAIAFPNRFESSLRDGAIQAIEGTTYGQIIHAVKEARSAGDVIASYGASNQASLLQVARGIVKGGSEKDFLLRITTQNLTFNSSGVATFDMSNYLAASGGTAFNGMVLAQFRKSIATVVTGAAIEGTTLIVQAYNISASTVFSGTGQVDILYVINM